MSSSNKIVLCYLLLASSTTCGSETTSLDKRGSSFPSSSAVDELHINEDSRGSGSGLDEETAKEDPPENNCLFPSRNSFLNMLNIEFGMLLRTLLLRWTYFPVKETHSMIRELIWGTPISINQLDLTVANIIQRNASRLCYLLGDEMNPNSTMERTKVKLQNN